MASDDRSAEAWLARGIDAYTKRRFDEAAEDFEQAVASDSTSVQAHLALGAARLTLYLRGSFLPAPDFSAHDFPEDEWEAFDQRERSMRAEQNSTNWPLAEKSLRRANELDPQNKLVVEYLCALYSYWKDPLDNADRYDDAKRWLERLAELAPAHTYANFQCGLLLTSKAHKLLPNYGRFPSVPEPDLASLRAKAGPVLEEARQHLARALALHGDRTAASLFLDRITSMETYLADPEKSARELHEKFMPLFHEHMEAQKQANGDAEPSDSATISFHLTPEALAEDRERPFPPNPWRIPLN